VTPETIGVEFAGRTPSASPASGYHGQHVIEQKRLVDEALGIVENSQEKNYVRV
jgi:2-oxoglutarate dehydrogenase complex dehydrogenase (E1) component-like enzyme